MIVWTPRLTVVIAVIALGGCGNATAEPTTLPSVTPTVTPTMDETIAPADDAASDNAPTATPSAANVQPPVEPDNAHDYSADGVEAFTRYAIDVINYAYQTNDVSYLEQIMTPDCQTCANTVNRLTTIGEAGGRVEGGQMLPDRISVVGPASGVQTSAAVELVVTESSTLDAEGTTRSSRPERLAEFIFDLDREGELWKLSEIR